MPSEEYRLSIYNNEDLKGKLIARVRNNTNLDYFNGEYWFNTEKGSHRGLTKLGDGRYVLMHSYDDESKRDYGYVITEKEALDEIIKAQRFDLFKTKKFKDLKKAYDEMEGK